MGLFDLFTGGASDPTTSLLDFTNLPGFSSVNPLGDPAAAAGAFDVAGTGPSWGQLNTDLSNYAASLSSDVPTSPSSSPADTSMVPYMSASVPAILGGVGRFAMRFPALASAVQALRQRGVRQTYAKLWNGLKKYGPAAMAAIIGADAVRDLMNAGTAGQIKRRRMNAGNAKAVRRAVRRMCAFQNLYHRTMMAMPHSSGGHRSRAKCRTKKVCK